MRLNQLKLSDLSPSALATSLSHQYYTTSAHLTRYYLNLRIVYELESRVNEMMPKSNSAPAAQPATQQQPQQQQPPQQKPQPKSSGKPGGSAHKAGDTAPEQGQRGEEPPVPVLAKLEQHTQVQSEWSPRLELRVNNDNNGSVMGPVFSSPSRRSFLSGKAFSVRPGNHHKPSERSLV